MTSLTGFEALIRGKKVITLGAPFYAGWGLTSDLGPIPHRRLRRDDGSLQPRPSLAHLVHATLIAYPRYCDPDHAPPLPARSGAGTAGQRRDPASRAAQPADRKAARPLRQPRPALALGRATGRGASIQNRTIRLPPAATSPTTSPSHSPTPP